MRAALRADSSHRLLQAGGGTGGPGLPGAGLRVLGRGGRGGSCPRPAGKVSAGAGPAAFLQKPSWSMSPSTSSAWERSWDLSAGSAPSMGGCCGAPARTLRVSSPSLSLHFTWWWPLLSLPGSAPSDGFLLSLLGCLVSAGGQSGVLQGLHVVPRSISPGAADVLTGRSSWGWGFSALPC